MNFRKPALAAASAAVLAAGPSFLTAHAVRGQPRGQPPPATAQGRGGRVTAAPAADHPARFVRITQTASVDNAPVWIIERLRLYQAPPP